MSYLQQTQLLRAGRNAQQLQNFKARELHKRKLQEASIRIKEDIGLLSDTDLDNELRRFIVTRKHNGTPS